MTVGRAPDFWWRPPGWRSRALAPAAALYSAVAGRRLKNGQRWRAPAPVICVGNPVAGGGGKTPTALALAKAARARGLRPGFLSRGHGGNAAQPLLVDPQRHDASIVGDEPLLLAAFAPTAVSRDRAAGAALLVDRGACDLIIMDDGFQSAQLAFDLALLVVDSSRGTGNGAVIPAGPLRAPLGLQTHHADALVIVGAGEGAAKAEAAAHAAGKPVHRARTAPTNAEGFAGRRVLAFSGIADPAKFHASLRESGAEITQTRDFPDHHPFTEGELGALLADAGRRGLTLATTRKDAVRLQACGALGLEVLEQSLVLEIEMHFEPPETAAALVRQAVEVFAKHAG
ncbi:tetraacyldisaccharide 4'-kinase [Aureimonas mangrovi]|uniref:tetraacyldisaccharide 4'-kinase n=1 Tax=Aureimonas mangrovi TaxID=2758041 RepID=UPI00163D62E1|nr:tetraacyldisaccharide 4'-kinase [Aureimonas mangrovi]